MGLWAEFDHNFLWNLFTLSTTLKKATIACAVNKSSVTVKGALDNFSLGPLAVQGVNDPHPTLDVEISPSKQHVDIDGKVVFFDDEAAVSIQVDILPTPTFSFTTVSVLYAFSFIALSNVHPSADPEVY